MFHLSPEGVIMAANDYVQALLQHPATDLIGRSWEDLCRPLDLAAVRDWWQRLQRGERASHLEVRLCCRDGSSKPVLISGQLVPDPEPHCIFLVFDLSEYKAREEQVLAAERQRRNLLIREVHHRIKNNLQGIVGLLQNQVFTHPELAEYLEAPIRQINSIALLYDLRSCGEEDSIFLCDLTRVAARACGKISDVPVTMDIPRYCSVEVNDNEAVAVALIINELLFNAIKHGSTVDPKVGLSLRRQQDCATVTVRNRFQGMTPDLDKPETLGTGLQLVRSLLPREGSARLEFSREGDDMVAELRLYPPTIRFRPTRSSDGQ